MTDKEIISMAMSLLGSRKSDAKAAASRANGLLGGDNRNGKKMVGGEAITRAVKPIHDAISSLPYPLRDMANRTNSPAPKRRHDMTKRSDVGASPLLGIPNQEEP